MNESPPKYHHFQYPSKKELFCVDNQYSWGVICVVIQNKRTFYGGIPKLLANNIKKYRKMKSATQAEMAKQIDIGRTALSRIENGAYAPSAKTMKKISDYFNIPIGDIFFNTDISENNTEVILGTDQHDDPLRINK